MTIREKTLTGMLWSFIEGSANYGTQFVFGIILARILTPADFGLMGMLAVFIGIAQTFVDSGFSSALIRKSDCTQTDYSTVFYYNLAASILVCGILIGVSGLVSSFFSEPRLQLMLQLLAIGVIVNAFGVIQLAILTKAVNFKLQALVSLLASAGSGIIGVLLALQGFGVWSLVGLSLSRSALTSMLLWRVTGWKPLLTWSRESFQKLFGFGGKLLVSVLMETTFKNLYFVVIGRYFSAAELGYYTRADQFRALPAENLAGIIGRVSYPVLSSIQHDKVQLKRAFQKLLRSTMVLTFMIMMGLAANAKPLVLTQIGEKWLPAVGYIQMLCFVGMFYPLHTLNLKLLQVQGRSDLFLRLELIKKILAIPTIIIGIMFGVRAMIISLIVYNVLAYYLNSYWTGRLLGYSFLEQVQDIVPSFCIAALVSATVWMLGVLLVLPEMPLVMLQCLLGGVLWFGVCEVLGFGDYLNMKHLVLETLSGRLR